MMASFSRIWILSPLINKKKQKKMLSMVGPLALAKLSGSAHAASALRLACDTKSQVLLLKKTAPDKVWSDVLARYPRALTLE